MIVWNGFGLFMAAGLAKVQVGQVIQALTVFAVAFGVGAYVAFLRPHLVYRAVDSGKISEEQGREKLRKLPPVKGVLFMFITLFGFLVMAGSFVFHAFFG